MRTGERNTPGAMKHHEEPRIDKIVEVLQGKKGIDILLMDLREISDVADYFVLCTGTSEQHVKSLADEVAQSLKELGDAPWHTEGNDTRRWILVDFVDIVVHVFRQEARDFYSLERLWGDAQCTEFADTWEPETRPRSPFEFTES
jgi:ribosome-associated protein